MLVSPPAFIRTGKAEISNQALRLPENANPPLLCGMSGCHAGPDNASSDFSTKSILDQTTSFSAERSDRKSGGKGKSGSVRVDLGGRRIFKKTIQSQQYVEIYNH